MECYAFHQIVLGSFDNLQVATLQGVAESDNGSFTAHKRYSLGFLRLITVNRVFRYRIGRREQALHGDSTVCTCFHGLAEIIARNGKGDICHNTILGSLFKGKCTRRRFNVHICCNSIHIFNARDNILQVRVAIGNELCTGAYSRDIVSCGGNPYRAAYGRCGADSQLIARFAYTHIPVRACEIVFGKDAVIIR